MKNKKYLIIFLIAVMVFLTSCGGLNNANEISAKNLITSKNLMIELNVKNSPAIGSWSHFAVEQDIHNLSQELLGKNSVEYTDVIDDKYIVIKAENRCPFLMKEIAKNIGDGENDHRYAFFAPTARFSGDKDIFFPYHFLSDVEVQYYPGYDEMCFYEEQSFKANCDMSDIYEFYKSIDMYTVRLISDNTIKVIDSYSEFIFTVSYDADSKTINYKFSEI